MKTSTRQIGNITIVDISGRIVLEETHRLRQVICDLLGNGYRQIILNLADAEYIDSAGLGCLVGSFTSARKHNADLKLLSPSEKVRNAMRITKLDTVFDIINDEMQGVKSFGQSTAASA